MASIAGLHEHTAQYHPRELLASCRLGVILGALITADISCCRSQKATPFQWHPAVDVRGLPQLTHIVWLRQVNGLQQVKFKDILQHYKKQPQCRTEVFRTVIIEQSLDDHQAVKTGDIIEFYNSVLIPACKGFVLE